ncbi:hypothetical protein AGABI1DRAFT_129265 [Agaricus bisporus var. burnettii JB137-S8]|uniref:Uncharacterized protein n=1 Tax=Agaricus bisporus var. burnettii (strain JB137-S8 / ATCC MYA-4627 / FGSC 10392) TaxID=597362 RepID=K5XV30_AGABU|nr:uncharacterized protein AGABI1DRAFT_129265 [Agaricus bisporus var. burnettii JB137-S8]EKM79000.1 hypothetical protein AGABI1DRAFT_129265 [Agaricus bisporus var. burnettii JB137-S8]
MTMHPELKRALDTNISALEVIRLFTKHHSGVPEERIDLRNHQESKHSDLSFWDAWQPLFQSCPSYWNPRSAPASEAFLSIHKDLTREVVSWLCDSGRRSNVYLIEEAQTRTENVNENFRANVFASICYDAHRFGLPLRGAPGYPPMNIFQLCAVLAAHYPPFRRILTEILLDYTEILNLPTRTRFKKLIYEPWKSLQISHPQYVATPPVIVLRCDDPAFWDEELLRSIYEFASPRQALPLLWIISFNPEFELPIQDLFDFFECPLLTRVPVCYNDAPADTELFLHHRFSIIHQKHKEMFTEHEVWPSEEQMSHLTRIFLGSFDAVDIVTQFVDWDGNGGPTAHLKTFLAYMVGSPSPSDERPYCALDHFYIRAFSNVPPDLLPVVKKVLSVYYCETAHFVTSFQLACLLSCRHDTVLDVLPYLCRWAVISDTQHQVVRYKPSRFFRGFLEDAKRSRHFNIRKSGTRAQIYEVCLPIICHFSNPSQLLKPVGRSALKAHGSEVKGFIHYALRAFYHVSTTGSHPEWTLLRRFDFRCLVPYQSVISWILLFPFIQKLYAWDKNNSPSIVRIKPASHLDSQFIDKCKGLATPLELQEMEHDGALRPTGPKYVLLGLEARTVLVVLATTRGPGVKSRYCGYSIYSEDGQRSRHFNISKSEISILAFEVSLRIVGHSSHPSELLKPVGRPALKAHGSEIAGFMHYALDTFYNVPDAGSHPEWIFKLRRFDFRCPAHSWSTSDGFRLILFVKSLYAWDKDNSPNIVRVKPAGPLDSQFIEKCEGLAEPLDLEEKGGWWEPRPTGPKYVLLGFEAGTVLVMLPTDTNRHPLGEPTYCGFNIYTSAMLEYM